MMKISVELLIVYFGIYVSLVVSAPTENDCECGLNEIKSRIKNGEKVKGHKYPWIGHIRTFVDREADEYYQCGGTLIDKRHVITAAHCLEKENGSFIDPTDVDVYLGLIKVSFRDEPFEVEKIWTDPLYDREELSNDFAILTLSESVKFDRYISPICLPNSEEGVNQFTVAGWGRVGSNFLDGASDNLLETKVNLIPRDKCNEIFLNYLIKNHEIEPESASKDENNSNQIAESHLCAINYSTGGDSCSGDSGGPLMYKNLNNSRHYLMGIVSGSWEDCGVDEEAASLYTRTLYYRNIIRKKAPKACWRDL